MPNMKALSHRIKKLLPMLKFFKSRSKVTVKGICAKFIVPSESSRFDGPIHPMADLEMFFPLNFF